MAKKSKKYYLFTERNSWEGETWRFFCQLTPLQAKKIQQIVKGSSNYSLSRDMYTEEDVTLRINSAANFASYMSAYNKCVGVTLPAKVTKKTDPDKVFYKGKAWKLAQ